MLAILGLMRVAYVLMNDCLAATPKRSTLMGVQALWLVALVPVLFIGARLRGITGVSIGHVAVAALLVGPAFLWAMSSVGHPRALHLPGLPAALPRRGADGGGLAGRHPLSRGRAWLGLAAATVAALAVYAPIVYPMRKLIRKAPPDEDDDRTPDQPDRPDSRQAGPGTSPAPRRAETPADRPGLGARRWW